MEEKVAEIKKITGCGDERKFKTIQADFSKLITLDDYEGIAKELSSIDVGILVLNAGWAEGFHTYLMPE